MRHYIHAVGGYRYNWHEEYEIMLILIGSADVCVEGEIYSLEADDLLIINPGQGHASLSKKEECIAMVLHLHPSFFEGITDLSALNFHCNSVKDKRPAAVYETLRKWLCRIFLTLEDTSSSGRVKLLGNLYFFINDLLLEFPPSQSAVNRTKKDEKQLAQIKKVLIYIEEKHMTKLTLKELAEYAGYNESYLSSLFKKVVGIIMLPLLIGIANEIGLSRKRLLYPVMAVANIATAMTILGQGASNMTWSDVMIKAGGTIPFTVWDFTVARIPVLILSIVYMATIGYRLLPDVPNEEFEDYDGKQGTKSNLTLTPAKEIISLVICCLTILLMFVSNSIHIPMYIIPCIGAVLLVITGVMSEKEALSSIHLPTVFLFAGVLPLSDAMAKSGAGDAVADIMIKMLGNTTNPYIIMLVFILFPLILTQLMSNLATVAIFIPLASTVAVKIGIDPRAAVMASLIAGCASFLTPMAAPCQAMIMGPGGYKLKDYLKSGLPLIIMIVVVTVFYLPLIFPF